jgi:hypothetical protein
MTNEEVLFSITRVVTHHPDYCKQADATCKCVAVAAVKEMERLGLLNARGEDLAKWVS